MIIKIMNFISIKYYHSILNYYLYTYLKIFIYIYNKQVLRTLIYFNLHKLRSGLH